MIQVRALSGEVLWGPEELPGSMSCQELLEQLRMPMACDLLWKDVLIPLEVRLSDVFHDAGPLEEVTLVRTQERSEFPPGLYISELNNHRLTRWTLQKNAASTVVLGGFGRGALPGQLAGPRGLAAHRGTGTLFVAELGNQRVTGWSFESGRWVQSHTFTGTKKIPLLEPTAICVDENGPWLYIADSKAHMVSRWRLEVEMGEIVAGGLGPGETLEQLDRPTGVAVDSFGRVYVTEFGNDRVTRWTPRRGAIAADGRGWLGEVVAGGQGYGDDLEQLAGPTALTLQERGEDVSIVVCEASRISRWWPFQRSRCEVLVGSILVAEGRSNRVTRWTPGAYYGEVVVGGFNHCLGGHSGAGAMPLQSSHVFASHIGHTGKTTLAYQMSSYYASKHPDLMVLIMDLAEEGDLTKRLLGGVDAAAAKVETLFGGVFRLLQAAEKRPSGLTSWLWSTKFDVMEHAVKLRDHNPALPENLYLISSGAWPREEQPMTDEVRKSVVARIRQSLDEFFIGFLFVLLRKKPVVSFLEMAKSLFVAALFGGFGSVQSAVRSVTERIANGECIDPAAYSSDISLFTSKMSGFPASDVVAAESDVTAANLISFAYGNHFKVISEELSKEQYVLTQCGLSQPTDAEIDALMPGTGYQRKHFTIPLQKVTVASTTILTFLDLLNVEDRVAYLDSFATGACWQKANSCGGTLESSFGNATLREQHLNTVDAVFMDCGSDCSNVNAQGNAVHFPATKESGNLHSAEYIKFLAAFFNLEAVANNEFQKTVTAYTSYAITTNRPVVAWVGYNSWSKRYELFQATYRLQLTNAAGGTMVNGTQVAASIGSKMKVVDAVAGNAQAGKLNYVDIEGDDQQAAANLLLGALQDVDILVDETYAAVPGDYTFSTFLSTYFLTAQSNYKFMGKVLRLDGRLSENNGYDWFESRVAAPHMAVGGLARYVKDDTSRTRTYFRNIADNEQPEVITAAMCTSTLPICNSSSYATPLTGISIDMSSCQTWSLLSIPAILTLWL
eukprot:symbB.v1.2.025185.t1/scaffold2422.1/size79552/5